MGVCLELEYTTLVFIAALEVADTNGVSYISSCGYNLFVPWVQYELQQVRVWVSIDIALFKNIIVLKRIFYEDSVAGQILTKFDLCKQNYI